MHNVPFAMFTAEFILNPDIVSTQVLLDKM
jgi:hypothetical protein